MSKSSKNKKIKKTKSSRNKKNIQSIFNLNYKNDKIDKFLKKQDKIIEKMKKKSKIKDKSELYVALLFTTIINGSLIHYLNYLEEDNCNCDINWEHHYIKYFALLIIINSIITIYFYKSIIKHNNKDMNLFKIILVVTSILYAYLLFKYFGRVNNKKETSKECNKCATEDLKTINIFFYYYRYLYLLLLIVLPIIIVLIIILYKLFY